MIKLQISLLRNKKIKESIQQHLTVDSVAKEEEQQQPESTQRLSGVFRIIVLKKMWVALHKLPLNANSLELAGDKPAFLAETRDVLSGG